jgi:alpha-galactosidase
MENNHFEIYKLTIMEHLVKTCLFTIIGFLLISCNPAHNTNVNVESLSGDSISLKNGLVKLDVNENMYCSLFYNKLSLNADEAASRKSLPTHFLKIDGTLVKNFKLLPGKTESQKINTEFGSGNRLILEGLATIPNGIRISKRLVIDLYDKLPSTFIMYAEYRNLSDEEVIIDESYSAYLKLDASMVNENDFHLFQGTSGRPAPQKYASIPDTLNEDNYIGRSEKYENEKEGFGGIPVTDVWCAKTGIGIGHIDPVWQNLFMPVKVDEDKKTVLSILEKPGLNLLNPYILGPDQHFRTVRSFINLHDLDFFSTANVYAQLMEKQNINFETSYTPADYAVSWCSWNEYATESMASKHDVMVKKAVMDRVNELNPSMVQQIIFDAGWFNNQGDWRPNSDPKSFPGGEEEFIATIKSIHDRGFRVMLWLSFLTADSFSEVAQKHPDWMITKSNGDFFYDRWSGYTMCPSLPEVQEYHKQLANRLVQKYNVDAFKIDGMYICPPCYNPEHHHKNPNESSADFYKVFKSFYDEAKKINPEVTLIVCPCGTTVDYTTLPYFSQTIGADPELPITVRQMSKLYKALKGENSPYCSDDINFNNDEIIRLPTVIGSGAIPQFFYGSSLSAERKNFYNHWLQIYQEEKLHKAQFENLYDMYYDNPETYVFRKKTDGKEIIYYSFFEDNAHFEGEIQLRGLNPDLNYTVVNYPDNINLGKIEGNNPMLKIIFDNYLLIKCVPD